MCMYMFVYMYGCVCLRASMPVYIHACSMSAHVLSASVFVRVKICMFK